MSYFDKFKDVKSLDASLDVDEREAFLWVDEDMQEGMAFRGAMDRFFTYVLGGAFDFDVCTQSEAEDFLDNSYYMIVLDNDAYHGRTEGPETLRRIRSINPDIPIVYTTALPTDVSQYVKDNVQEVIQTTDLGLRLPELKIKYGGKE